MEFQLNGASTLVKVGANGRYPASSKLSTEQRAVRAAWLTEQAGFKVSEAADLACTNSVYVSLVRRMSGIERLRLAAGVGPSLSELANRHRQHAGDRRVDRLVAEVGIGRVWGV